GRTMIPAGCDFLPRPYRSPGRKRSDTMFELDLPWIYRLGADVKQLIRMRRAAFSDNVQAFGQAKDILESIANESADNGFDSLPESREKAVVLLREVDKLIGLVNARQAFTAQQQKSLRIKFLDFESTLLRELDRIRAFAISGQRMISVEVMLNRPERLFADNCWKRMPALARTDVKNGASCLAFDCFTASGFHFLRAVETTIKQYRDAISKTLSVPVPCREDWGVFIDFLKK